MDRTASDGEEAHRQELMPGGIGRYQFQRVLATDGAATVHEAVDTETGNRVALGRWPVDPGLSVEGRERMRATAVQAQGLQHPGIVELHEFGWHGNSAYAVTAFVEGETLAQFLARAQRLPALQGLSLSLQLLAALAAAHERGLVHSALNPQHVLVGRNGQLKIAGFGWVAAAASAGRRPGVFDVPAYMAPEQILGRPADCRSDLYSAAVLAYELLTGSWPYQAHTAPRPARVLRPELPAAVDAVFERAQARDPEERHRNAAELAAALQAAFGTSAQGRAIVPVRPNRVAQASAPVPARLAPAPRSEAPDMAPAVVRHRRGGVALVAGVAAAVILGVMFAGVGVEGMRSRFAAPSEAAAPAAASAAAAPLTPENPPPAPAQPPLAAVPAQLPALPTVHAVPATAEAPKAALPRETPKPVRAAALVTAATVPTEPRQRRVAERPVEPGVREIRVAEPIEVPAREVASAPLPAPPPVARASEAVERPAPQRTAAAEPPQRRATAVMAAPPSPSPLTTCRQESSMARELCAVNECATAKFRYHPVCLRMYEDAIVRHQLNRQDGP